MAFAGVVSDHRAITLAGAAAGQTVFHLHFHIIPSMHGTALKLHAREMADPKLLAKHAERVKAALASLRAE